MKKEDIERLPPELQPAAELCEKLPSQEWARGCISGYSQDDIDFHREARTALPLALTYCLQMQEERDVFAQVAKQNMDAYVNEQECRAANQTNLGIALEKLSTAEATIATLTREKEQLTSEIIRLHCTTGAALSHTPEGRK